MRSSKGELSLGQVTYDALGSALVAFGVLWFASGMPTGVTYIVPMLPSIALVLVIVLLKHRSIRQSTVAALGNVSITLRRLGAFFVDIFVAGIIVVAGELIGIPTAAGSAIQLSIVLVGLTYLLVRNVAFPSVGSLFTSLRVVAVGPLAVTRLIFGNVVLFAPGWFLIAEGASGSDFGTVTAFAGVVWIFDMGRSLVDGRRASEIVLLISAGGRAG